MKAPAPLRGTRAAEARRGLLGTDALRFGTWDVAFAFLCEQARTAPLTIILDESWTPTCSTSYASIKPPSAAAPTAARLIIFGREQFTPALRERAAAEGIHLVPATRLFG